MDADGITHHLLHIDASSTQQASTPSSTALEHSKERPATEQQQ
jgi:hypothetical protein